MPNVIKAAVKAKLSFPKMEDMKQTIADTAAKCVPNLVKKCDKTAEIRKFIAFPVGFNEIVFIHIV